MRRSLLLLLLLLTAPWALGSCGNADFVLFQSCTFGCSPPGTTIIVRWSDSPIDGAEALWVGVDRVELVRDGGTDVLEDRPRRFEMLGLRNGAYAVLADTVVPTGVAYALRVVLSPDDPGMHTITLAGESFPMLFDAPGDEEILLPFDAPLPEDDMIIVHVDLNARLSVFEAGDGYRLRPHASLTSPETAGSLAGRVLGGGGLPVSGAVVSAQQGFLEAASTHTAPDGTWSLGPLAAGAYELVVTSPGSSVGTASAIVLAGQDTDTGVVTLLPAAAGGLTGTTLPGLGLSVRIFGAEGLLALAGVDPLTGTFSFAGVPAGSYMVELWGPQGVVLDVATGVLVPPSATGTVTF